jgi:acetyl-CoA carboxylase biotin carboxyl carrier protein
LDVVNWQEVRLLLAALQESDVTELILEYKDFRLTLRKGIPAGLAAAAAAPPAAPPPEPPPCFPCRSSPS